MIALDTNMIVFADRQEAPFHARARELLRKLAEGRALWALPWPCLHEFVAVVSNRRIFKHPTPRKEAVSFVELLASSPSFRFLGETSGHLSTLAALLASSQASGPMVHDARIAAICIEHSVEALWTADRDFGRFPTLRTLNPLLT